MVVLASFRVSSARLVVRSPLPERRNILRLPLPVENGDFTMAIAHQCPWGKSGSLADGYMKLRVKGSNAGRPARLLASTW